MQDKPEKKKFPFLRSCTENIKEPRFGGLKFKLFQVCPAEYSPGKKGLTKHVKPVIKSIVSQLQRESKQRRVYLQGLVSHYLIE